MWDGHITVLAHCFPTPWRNYRVTLRTKCSRSINQYDSLTARKIKKLISSETVAGEISICMRRAIDEYMDEQNAISMLARDRDALQRLACRQEAITQLADEAERIQKVIDGLEDDPQEDSAETK